MFPNAFLHCGFVMEMRTVLIALMRPILFVVSLFLAHYTVYLFISDLGLGFLINAATWTCPEGSFKCLDGAPMCIPQTRLCDKVIHCQDGSDESQCGMDF